MLSYSVYFEIKHQKWSICVSLLSTCVCKIWLKEKVPLVIEILAKQRRGSFLWDTLYIWKMPVYGTELGLSPQTPTLRTMFPVSSRCETLLAVLSNHSRYPLFAHQATNSGYSDCEWAKTSHSCFSVWFWLK